MLDRALYSCRRSPRDIVIVIANGSNKSVDWTLLINSSGERLLELSRLRLVSESGRELPLHQ